MSSQIGPLFAHALRSMHATEPQADADGLRRQIDDSTRISEQEGMVLHSLAVEGGVTESLEVGLAYGFSTAYLLAGLETNGGGSHTAIDPFQFGDWHGIGLALGRRLAAGSERDLRFEWLEMYSDVALAGLIDDGRTFGLIFIDGYHRFDDVLVDFTMAARMCPVGGVIVLHDMWLNSIAAVASFIRTNRTDFAPIDTGCENLFAVRRIGADERDWTHFVAFETGERDQGNPFG